MVDLRTSKGKKIQHKRMGRERKSQIHVGKEQHTLISLRKGFLFLRRWNATDMARKHTRFLVGMEHLRRDNGRKPLPSRHGTSKAPRPEELSGGRSTSARQ